MFQNPLINQYYNNLLPSVYNSYENIVREDGVIVNDMNEEFKNEFIKKNRDLHRQAIEKEKRRKEEAEKQRKADLEVYQ